MLRAGIRRSFLATLGLCVLVVLFAAAVIASSQWPRAPRVDLTEDGLYTLSKGTLKIIDNLRQPIRLTLYFSSHATRDLPKLRSYEQRVRDMLQEMAARSHGRIRLKVVDPVPYSDDEDRAFGAGLTAMPGGNNGERVFFGLSGRNVRGTQLAIPFFDPNEEAFLEYNIAKLLYELDMQHKPRVDIISSLPIDGDPVTDSPPWAIMRQLHQLFDIHMLDASKVDKIAGNVKTLLVIHPKNLPGDALHAIDQYVLHGGHLVVFVDPDAEMDALPVGAVAGSIAGSHSDLPKLFKAWGVEFDPDEVVLDRSRALSIAMAGSPEPVRHPAMLGLTSSNINHHDVITASLRNIDVSSSGYFELAPHTDSRLEPLVQTSGDAMVVPARRVRLTVDPTTLFEHYQPSGEHYVIAARLRGVFHTAFPEDLGKGDIKQAQKPNEIILVADTDILSNRMWVQPTPFLGETLLSAFAGNGDFVTNIIDYLSGSSALISIRGRATSQRPFTRVEAMRRAADEKFRLKEHELEQELIATEKRLAKLQPGKANPAPGNSEQRKELDRNLKRKLAIRKQLRDVQHQLNAEIDSLGVRLKLINILLIPLLLALVGIGYGIWRSRRGRRHRKVRY
ncbi:MAG TPA: Gldg family protein [Oleiagrimonas sp.]|nr:Gldg family protein [Oleiagrimonas sp.]